MGRINEIIRLDRENGAASEGGRSRFTEGRLGKAGQPLATNHHPAGRQPGALNQIC